MSWTVWGAGSWPGAAVNDTELGETPKVPPLDDDPALWLTGIVRSEVVQHVIRLTDRAAPELEAAVTDVDSVPEET